MCMRVYVLKQNKVNTVFNNFFVIFNRIFCEKIWDLFFRPYRPVLRSREDFLSRPSAQRGLQLRPQILYITEVESLLCSQHQYFLQPMVVGQVAQTLEGYAYTHRIWSYNM